MASVSNNRSDYDINQIKISEELIINKDYVLKSLKHYVYLLILNNYTNNRELYYYLLHEFVFKLNFIHPDNLSGGGGSENDIGKIY